VTDLEDLYREIILDHYRSPRNRGELESPPAHRVEGFNPLCGDEVVVTLLVEDGRVTDIKFAGSGCSISQSSASLMSSAVKGKVLDEVRELIRTFKSMMSIHEATLGPEDAPDGTDGEGAAGDASNGGPAGNGLTDVRKLGELAALQGVVKFPVRIKCATLSWNALAQGLDEVAAAS
jgi:nitrogen fixation protein NifU and related proteins